jgi:hypothetical protein
MSREIFWVVLLQEAKSASNHLATRRLIFLVVSEQVGGEAHVKSG